MRSIGRSRVARHAPDDAIRLVDYPNGLWPFIAARSSVLGTSTSPRRSPCPAPVLLIHRLPAALAFAALLIGAVVFIAHRAPRRSATHALLFLKGAGNSYLITQPSVVVARAGASGQTPPTASSYNVGQTEAQFVLSVQQAGLTADVGLYEGSVFRRLANTADGYVTEPIPSGTGITYTLKIRAVDTASRRGNASATVKLAARDGVVLGTGTGTVRRSRLRPPVRARADPSPPDRATSAVRRKPHGHAVRPVAVRPGRWHVQVHDQAGRGRRAPHRIRTYIPVTDPACQSYTAKEGTKDVTAAVRAGTYYTKVLNPGQSSC